MRLEDPEVKFEKGIETIFDQQSLEMKELHNELREVFYLLAEKLENNDLVVEIYDRYHLVEHTGYHVVQIVDRTKRMKGKRFDFVKEGIHEQRLKEHLN